MKNVIIIGAGGHGKVVADIIRLNGDNVVGYLDDRNPAELSGVEVIGTLEDIGKEDCFYFSAIGNSAVREKTMSIQAKWYTAIHPRAVIASDVVIGEGSCVMANAVINPGATLGKGVIVNTSATVDHDCFIEDFVHIAPGANISGAVSIGKSTWIGVGSAVSNNVSICAECMIGAGTVVIKDIRDSGTYVGVPAKRTK